jgi:hypothetical protein
MRHLMIVTVLCVLAVPAWAQTPQHDHAATGEVGSASVRFETSCAPTVAPDFNRGVALLHSFWFAEAIRTFNGVLATVPSCAMAHWGIALSEWGNPFAGLKAPEQVQRGRAAIDKAESTGSPTARERAYIRAQSDRLSH